MTMNKQIHYIIHCESCHRDIYGQCDSSDAPHENSFPCPYCGKTQVEIIDMNPALTLEQAKAALDAGLDVRWQNGAYICTKDQLGQYLCTYRWNDSTVSLDSWAGRGFFLVESKQ